VVAGCRVLGRLSKKLFTVFSLTVAMAKSLGQIHTANVAQQVSNVGDKVLIDLPGILTNQLQTMVRQGQYFKVVGIDMTCSDLVGAQGEVAVAGVLRYYAPTRGRCAAYKNAYHAVRKGMELQGINIRGNRHYDFRVPMGLTTGYLNGASFLNQATIDGTNMLTLDATAGSVTDEVFTVYNSNIQPEQTATVAFSTGFGLPGGAGTTTDFVLNEGEYYEGSMTPFAEIVSEEIPFSISFGQDGAQGLSSTMPLQWRPDPALYLAVLTGQIEIDVQDINDSVPGTFVQLEVAVHVAGWKSIMGTHGKKRTSRKGKKSGRRHSKK